MKCPSCGHAFKPTSGRPPQPDVLIECDCGASWSGKHAVNNPVIKSHRERERNGASMGGYVKCRVVVVRDNRPTEALAQVTSAAPRQAPQGSKALRETPEITQLRMAVGLMTTLKPSMVMRADDPVGMTQEVIAYLRGDTRACQRCGYPLYQHKYPGLSCALDAPPVAPKEEPRP